MKIGEHKNCRDKLSCRVPVGHTNDLQRDSAKGVLSEAGVDEKAAKVSPKQMKLARLGQRKLA